MTKEKKDENNTPMQGWYYQHKETKLLVSVKFNEETQIVTTKTAYSDEQSFEISLEEFNSTYKLYNP